MSLADKLKKKSITHWTTLRGEKIGVRRLTRNEMKQHCEKITNLVEGDDRGLFSIFAEYLTNDQGEQALTVDEMEEVLTDAELADLLGEFNKANGLSVEPDSKN